MFSEMLHSWLGRTVIAIYLYDAFIILQLMKKG